MTNDAGIERSISWATRNHTGKNIANRNMVSFKSRAGAIKRRSHFLTTEPEFEALPRQDARTHNVTRYGVYRGKTLIIILGSLNQANSYARNVNGRVSIL